MLAFDSFMLIQQSTAQISPYLISFFIVVFHRDPEAHGEIWKKESFLEREENLPFTTATALLQSTRPRPRPLNPPSHWRWWHPKLSPKRNTFRERKFLSCVGSTRIVFWVSSIFSLSLSLCNFSVNCAISRSWYFFALIFFLGKSWIFVCFVWIFFCTIRYIYIYLLKLF